MKKTTISPLEAGLIYIVLKVKAVHYPSRNLKRNMVFLKFMRQAGARRMRW